MKIHGAQRRLTILIGQRDHHGHTALTTEIVRYVGGPAQSDR